MIQELKEDWQIICSIKNIPFVMELISTINSFADLVYELSFVVGIIVTVAFYIEYKKCAVEIEKQEMLDHFLND